MKAEVGTVGELCGKSTLSHLFCLSLHVDQKLPVYCRKSFLIRQNSGFDLRSSSNIKQFLQALQFTGQRNYLYFKKRACGFELFIDMKMHTEIAFCGEDRQEKCPLQNEGNGNLMQECLLALLRQT